MSTTNAAEDTLCQHCGMQHIGPCHRIAAIEYYPDGRVKRVEYVKPQPVQVSPRPDLAIPGWPWRSNVS